MATHKPFRELIKPGTNFEFMGRAKLWVSLSLLFVAASIAMLFVNKAWRGDYMNWSTDFKGGTEIILGFHKAGTDHPIEVDPADLRKAISAAGLEADVSEFSWEEETSDGTERATGALVRTADFGAVDAELQELVATGFAKEFASIEPLKVSWSGDRMFVRSKKPVDWKASKAFLAKHELDLRDWDPSEAERFHLAEEGTGEYQAQLAVAGIDEQYRAALSTGLGEDVDVRVVNVYGVGAKAGAKLRNDGITSLFYAMMLIMLYLVVRFDLRYAPGAVLALVHDSILVVGAFAVTWMEFSLVTVAAILTIIGYSVNDTVIIFDRIRENAAKMQDKKFARIMNISINETLSRSLLTSLTVFAVTLMMNIFGTGLVRNFAFAMNIGVVFGTYSSIFIASPIALWIHNRWYGKAGKERGKVVDEAMESTEGAE